MAGDHPGGQDPGPLSGDADDPEKFATEWAGLEVGVDTKKPLSEFYGEEVISAITEGPTTLNRWAIPQGQGNLLGALQGEMPVATAVNEVSSGGSGQEAATKAAEAITSVKDSLR